MAINNFQFPGVELTQEFVSTPVTGISTLGVVVVGPQFKLMTADVNNEDLVITDWAYAESAKTITKAELPGTTKYNEDGEIVDDPKLQMITGYTASILVSGGTFENYVTGTTVATKSIAVAGSTIAPDLKTADIQFDTKITSGTAAVAIFGQRFPKVGDHLLVGAIDTIITNIDTSADTYDEVSVEITGTTLSGTTVGATNTFLAIETATVDNGVAETATGISITGGTATGAKLGGKSAPVKKLLAGTYDISVSFMMVNSNYVGQLGMIASEDEIKDIFGTISNENKMALALDFALKAAQTNVVYFTATESDTQLGYIDAMDFLDKYDEVYSVVPLTTETEIIKALIASAEKTSEDSESKVRRSIWYALDTPADGVADTNSAKVQKLIKARKDCTNSYRAQAVWGDVAYYNGEPVDNIMLAAAAAGMRAYEPTYRPISNLAYPFFSLKNPHGFTKSQLELLGANGVWIIDNNYEGTPSNKKQVTTAVSNDLNKDEESIVANADSIALTLCHVGEDKVGNSNISPALLKVLSDTITGVMDNYLVNLTGNAYIGPQLLSWSLDSLYQHQTMLDHIYAVITCEPPKPFNRFVMTLRIV